MAGKSYISLHVPYHFLTSALPFPYGKPHFGCPASKHFLQVKSNWRKDYCKKGIGHGRHIGAPYQIPTVGGGPDLVGGVRGEPCVGCLGQHTTKIASWLFDFSNTNSFYKSYIFGPPSASRTPPPIACCWPLMGPLGQTTFWLSGQQRLFAS